MANTPNTTTPIGNGERLNIVMSNSVPRSFVNYSPVPEKNIDLNQVNNEQLTVFEGHLGSKALDLEKRDQQIENLKSYITSLETEALTEINDAEDPEIQSASGELVFLDQTGLKQTIAPEIEVNSTEQNHHGLVKNELAAEPVVNTRENDNPPELSPSHKRYEEILSFLAARSGGVLSHVNCGRFIKQELGISNNDWNNAKNALTSMGVITYLNDPNNRRRTIEVKIDSSGLLANIHKPFITPRILNLINDTIAEYLPEEHAHTDKTPSSQDTIIAKEINPSVSGNALTISRRVLNALEIDPEPITGTRNRGKKVMESSEDPFLGRGHSSQKANNLDQLLKEKAETTAKPKISVTGKRMSFNFDVNGEVFEKPYETKAFSSVDPRIKLLLAVGQASTFTQSDEQYSSYLLRMVNKGLPEQSQINSDEVTNILHSLVDEGLCSNGGPRYRLTQSALETLVEESKQKHTKLAVVHSGDLQSSDNGKVSDIQQDKPRESKQLTNESLRAPLANERTADAFEVDQNVLLLVNESLVIAKVKSANAYESSWTIGEPVAISAEKKEHIEKLIEQRQAVIKLNNLPKTCMPDPEILRLRVMLSPIFQNIVPSKSPGCLKLTWPEDPVGMITDMNNNYIITSDAWRDISSSEEYLNQWLSSGSKESIARKDILEKAIKTALATKEFKEF